MGGGGLAVGLPTLVDFGFTLLAIGVIGFALVVVGIALRSEGRR